MVTGFHHCWSSGVARRVANRAVPWRHRVSARFGAITSAATFGHRIDPSDSGRVYWQRNVGGRHTLLPRRAFTVSGLEGWGLVSRLDATGTVYNLRRLTDFEGVYEFAVGGLQATRAGVLCGCKMQMASICGWSACAAGYR